MKPKFRLRSKFQKLSEIQKYTMTRLSKKRRAAHNSIKNTWNLRVVNDIVFNNKAHIVTLFKDNLIINDGSEYFKWSYPIKESADKLASVLCKIGDKHLCPVFRAAEPLTLLMKGERKKRHAQREFESRLMRRLCFGKKNDENIFDEDLKKSIDNVQHLHYFDNDEDKAEQPSNASLLSVFNMLRFSFKEKNPNPKLVKSSTTNKFSTLKEIKETRNQPSSHKNIIKALEDAPLTLRPKLGKGSIKISAASIKIPISPSNRRFNCNKERQQILSINLPLSNADAGNYNAVEMEAININNANNNEKAQCITTPDAINSSCLRIQRNCQSGVLPLISLHGSSNNNSLNTVQSSKCLRENLNEVKTEIDKNIKLTKTVKSKFFTHDTPEASDKPNNRLKLQQMSQFRKTKSISVAQRLTDPGEGIKEKLSSKNLTKRFGILKSKLRVSVAL